MKTVNTISRKRRRLWKRLFVPVLFLLSILLITYFYPKTQKFQYSFSEGRPWQYSLLTAPFDFPIFKSADQYQAEQDSILVYYEPYFVIDKNVSTNAIADFDADTNLKSNLKKLEPDYIIYIRSKLVEVYEHGIMNSEDHAKVSTSETKSVRLKEGNLATSRRIAEFKSIRSAYEQILADRPDKLDERLLKSADINNYLRENIIYDASTSEKAKNEFIQQVSPSTGMVQAGQRIIDEGEIIDSYTYTILSSLKRVTEERSGGASSNSWIIFGEFLLTLVFMGSFYLYLLFFRPYEFKNRKHVIFMLLLITFFVILTAVSVRFTLFNVYIIPFTIVTILIRTFIDSRTALFASIVTILLSSLMVPNSFEFIVIQITVAMVSIFMLKELTERSQLIRSSFFILLTYNLVYIGLMLYGHGEMKDLQWIVPIYFIINFIFVMFSYLLVYVFEKTFGFISGVSMVELANINKPLLKELSEKAPGTFQHSMQVSNLATAAASRIGANASLVRTGALYHDIGKMVNAAFFTENQAPNMNPHTGLPFEESARIIISHVKDGVKLAKQNGLPKQIIDFIETHHGTSIPKYFYVSWKNANPEKEINEEAFHYPGPNPFTKETAIMMMADAVEAASRSLQEYNEETLRNLVNKLIDIQLSEGYFRKAPITFRDVDIVKDVFVEKLKTIYHSRIAYPELKKHPN